jgi:4-alpha-glucanotransferase
VLVGEDLGTVPGEVRRSMRRRGLLRSYVLQLELQAGSDPFAQVPHDAMAGTNTHDMPTFAGFWEGEDIERRRRLGLVGDEDAAREREDRAELRRTLTEVLRRRGLPAGDERTAYESSILQLARSDACLLVVNLEDMWGETEPQNLPGTGAEQPNWRRRARYGVSELGSVADLTERLARINEARRGVA